MEVGLRKLSSLHRAYDPALSCIWVGQSLNSHGSELLIIFC